MSLGPMVPHLFQLPGFLGVAGGEVLGFKGIGREVYQFPGAVQVVAHQFPVICDDGTRTLVLKEQGAILQGTTPHGREQTGSGQVGVLESVGGVTGRGQIHAGRQQVDDVSHLFAYLTFQNVFPGIAEGHDEGGTCPALIDPFLITAVRCVGEVGHQLSQIAAFQRSSVVAQEEEDRVFQVPFFAESLDNLTHPVVHDFNHGGIGGHILNPLFALRVGKLLPGGAFAAELPVIDGQFHLGGNQAQRFLLLKPLLAQHVVSNPVASLALFNPVGRSLQGEVRGIVGYIEEHGGIGRLLSYETDGRVGYGRGVVIVVGQVGNGCQVVVKRGRLVVAASTRQAAIVAVEPALGGVAAVGSVESPVDRDMPFAAHVGVVSVGLQDFGNGRVDFRYLSSISRAVFVHGGHPAHAHLVLIATGEQRGTRRATAPCVLELTESYAGIGQAVQMRRLDFAAVTPQIREAHVVAHDEYDIGWCRFLGRKGKGCGSQHERYKQSSVHMRLFFRCIVKRIKTGSKIIHFL